MANASETAKAIERRKEYFAHLGALLWYYASVEWMINHLVRYYYKIPEQKANIALGQLPYDSAVDHLNRLRIAGIIPDDDNIEIILIKEQLGAITRLRNDMVHYTQEETPDGYILSTESWAYNAKKIRKFIVSTETLSDASYDLMRIFWRLDILIHPKTRDNIKKVHGEFAYSTWQYKPPALTHPDQEHSSIPPKQ